MVYNHESYRKRLEEHRESLTPEQKALHAEEARLEAAWKATECPKKKKAIKAAHSAIVDKLVVLCKFESGSGPQSRIYKRRKKVKTETYGEPDFEYRLNLRKRV